MPDKSAQRGTVPSVPITIERPANDLLVFPAISYSVEHDVLGRILLHTSPDRCDALGPMTLPLRDVDTKAWRVDRGKLNEQCVRVASTETVALVATVPLQSGQHLRRRIERGDDRIALDLG